MSQGEAIHTLARRYCEEQFSERRRRYEELLSRQPRREGDYSPEAYDAFPRYLILKAILQFVEALTPASASSATSLVEAMAAAAQSAEGNLTPKPRNAIARAAIADERAKFIEYIRFLTAEQIDSAVPLPYRRTLSKEEAGRLWRNLQVKWGADGEYWHPLKSVELPPGMLAFHTDYFDGAKERLLREFLMRRGITRMWELREGGDLEYELELALFEPRYNGAEGYWIAGGLDWLVYASHESSVTLAGEWLVAGFKEVTPDCEQYLYSGPFSTADLRGTWKWAAAD